MSGRRRVLIVTAVEAERAAVLAGLGLENEPVDEQHARAAPIVVDVVGVGVAAAASETATLVMIGEHMLESFDAVISAGIAGGYAGRADVGSTVLASRSVAADLGADSPDGFLPLATLGFGRSTVDADPDLLGRLRLALPDAVVGDVLTVSTATGTAERAAEMLARWPGAVAEAMEGFGVATAAARWQRMPFAELRTVSNLVGPRDRASWRIGEALSALTRAAAQLRDVLDEG